MVIKYILFIIIGAFPLLFSNAGKPKLPQQGGGLLQEIDQALIPLDTVSYAHQDYLSKAISPDFSILALGESTHGTKEFNIVKDCIIRNQILHNQVKIVAMETDFCSLLGLNSFLLNNKIPLDSTESEFYHSGIYGIYYTKEVLAMITWIKQYNLACKEEKEKVKLYGLDMQDPFSITQVILDSFPQLRSLNNNILEKIKELNQLYYSRQEQPLSNSAKAAYIELADSLASLIPQQVTGKNAAALLQYAELLKQTISIRQGIKQSRQIAKRDEYLAANAVWIFKNVGYAGDKMIVWSHNGHIAHATLEGRKCMGDFLREQFGPKYYAVDFLFGEGSVRIYDFKNEKKYRPFYYPSAAHQKSIEYVLKNAKNPLFFLEVRHNTNQFIHSFFENNTYQRVIGASYQEDVDKDYVKMPVLKCFDGIVFINKANAAENVR